MTWLSHLGLFDLVALAFVALSLVGALMRRRGVLGAVFSALGALVVCWLVAAGLLAWGSGAVREAAASSALVDLVPVPDAAVRQAHELGLQLVSWLRSATR